MWSFAETAWQHAYPRHDVRVIDLLALGRELHSIAQAGLGYSANEYERQRMLRLRELAAELLSELDGDRPEVVRRGVLTEEGYLTPKLDIRAAVRGPSGAVALVRESIDGRWTLPGGWADVGESLAEGAIREVREEAGLDVRVAGLLGLYERERRGHPPYVWFTLKAVVVCDPVDPAAQPIPDGHESLDARWFSPEHARALKLSQGRTSPQLLDRVLELLGGEWDGRADLD
jgi:ADP-ribose pyrophosphatase YjhB (NUDIX family)